MLGKLIKYEFRATGRIFLPMFGALLIVAAFSRLFYSLNFDTPSIIGTIIAVIMIIGIFVLTFIITIQRFNKNLLSNEGYLMFTLPVKTGSLIWSKLLVASVWSIASLFIVIIAVLIMAMTGVTLTEIAHAFRDIIRFFGVDNGNMALLTIEFIVLAITSLFSGILMLYACMALSMLVNKHRGLCAFGIYIIFNIIGQTLASIIIFIGATVNIDRWFRGFTEYQMAHSAMLLTIAGCVITGAVFYILTELMLKRKLNLE